MKRLLLPALLAISLALTGCQGNEDGTETSQSPETPTGVEPDILTEVGSEVVVWSEEDVSLGEGASEAIQQITPDERWPLLFTDADAWDAWVAELPDPLAIPETARYFDFNNVAVVVGFYDNCRMRPAVYDEFDGKLLFTTVQEEHIDCALSYPTVAVLSVMVDDLEGDFTSLTVRRYE